MKGIMSKVILSGILAVIPLLQGCAGPDAGAWRVAINQNTVTAYDEFLQTYPNSEYGTYARSARDRLLDQQRDREAKQRDSEARRSNISGNWSKLSFGMSREEADRLVGTFGKGVASYEFKRIWDGSGTLYSLYEDDLMTLTFDKDDKLSKWQLKQ